MASHNFPRKVNKQKIIKPILKQCVDFGFDITDDRCYEMRHWCRVNIGVEKQYHPIMEINMGWLEPDPLKPKWAWGIVDEKLNFWFNNREDRISFILTFK